LSKVGFFLAATVIVAAGCHDHLYDFGVSVVPGDASTPDAVTTGTGGGTSTGGTTGAGGSLPQDGGGTGGVAGTSGGTGGQGGMGGMDGGIVPTCNPMSPDLETDVANCGQCFHQCIVPNAIPSCVARQCQFTCQAGFYDADGNPANGCECTKTNGGVEICDGIDNDCNGIVDDGFDLTSDVNNCGGCNRQCAFPFALASCENSKCVQGDCLPNFYDRDPTVPGCETECIKTNGGVEICDGLDNDCDGIVDDNLAAPTLTCLSKGVCAGTVPTCQAQNGWVCNYPTTYEPVEDAKFGCDGLDNDCNGVIDDPFLIGKTCTVGSGPCAGTGSWVCDNSMPGDHRCAGTMKTPQPEVCDGIDNDCDGVVDELLPSNHTTDDVLVYVPSKNVTMYGYEATRYDASSSSAGFDSTKRGCSVAGKLPWANITMTEAEHACELIGGGWRLCTAPEWQAACLAASPANPTTQNPAYIFPYGPAYVGTKCNGNDFMGTPTTIPTGNASGCTAVVPAITPPQTYSTIFDLSGNVKEWTATDLTTTKPPSNPTCTTTPCLFEMRGGAYDTPSFSVGGAAATAPGLQCDASVSAPYTGSGSTAMGIDVRLPSVGFRCCYPGKFQ
jgi:hypothetical protein